MPDRRIIPTTSHLSPLKILKIYPHFKRLENCIQYFRLEPNTWFYHGSPGAQFQKFFLTLLTIKVNFVMCSVLSLLQQNCTHAQILTRTSCQCTGCSVTWAVCGQEAVDKLEMQDQSWQEGGWGVIRSSIIQHHQTWTIAWCQQAWQDKISCFIWSFGLVEFNSRAPNCIYIMTSCVHTLLVVYILPGWC